MKTERELWEFISARLQRGEKVMLLVVAESTGSSPGRPGFKMAVGADGELCGSIGGGVMEVNLVEQSKAILGGSSAETPLSILLPQVHRQNSANASGMICSGRQTVIFTVLTPYDTDTVGSLLSPDSSTPPFLVISRRGVALAGAPLNREGLELLPEGDFRYTEKIGPRSLLVIIGGGHCSLALSELASRLGFEIAIFDDRPELNTIEKNKFAGTVMTIDSYREIGRYVPAGDNMFVVVMTVGYRSDAEVICGLIDKDFRYFGVLGSRAKMASLFRELESDGCSKDRLSRIRTPAGLPINSHTPEEIAVSIAAEMISVRNS